MHGDMEGKICMVTGASAGIGKATASKLAGMGATVILVGRDSGRVEQARTEIVSARAGASVEVVLADLSSQASIRKLAADYVTRYQRLDVLINNVGAMFFRRQESVDGIEMTFALNHLSYFLLTNLLLETLKSSAPARIVNVSSNAHFGRHIDFNDLQRRRKHRFMEVYGHSKLANVLFTYELARRLDGTGVTANCLHPGLVASNMAKNNGWLVRIGTRLIKPFLLSPEQGAETSVYLASSPEVEGVTGRYFVEKREVPSSPESHDPAAAQRLWAVSEALTGINT